MLWTRLFPAGKAKNQYIVSVLRKMALLAQLLKDSVLWSDDSAADMRAFWDTKSRRIRYLECLKLQTARKKELKNNQELIKSSESARVHS